MTKDRWVSLGSQREIAFREIAETLGKEHTVTKMLGSLAWGRHDWEMGGGKPTLERAIIRAAALHGYFQAINQWARRHDLTAQDQILAIWDKHRRQP